MYYIADTNVMPFDRCELDVGLGDLNLETEKLELRGRCRCQCLSRCRMVEPDQRETKATSRVFG